MIEADELWSTSTLLRVVMPAEAGTQVTRPHRGGGDM